jgi:hypothetical protein
LVAPEQYVVSSAWPNPKKKGGVHCRLEDATHVCLHDDGLSIVLYDKEKGGALRSSCRAPTKARKEVGKRRRKKHGWSHACGAPPLTNMVSLSLFRFTASSLVFSASLPPTELLCLSLFDEMKRSRRNSAGFSNIHEKGLCIILAVSEGLTETTDRMHQHRERRRKVDAGPSSRQVGWWHETRVRQQPDERLVTCFH